MTPERGRIVEINKKLQRKLYGRRIIVTGAMGYIGSCIAQALSSVECDLVMLDREDSHWRPQTPAAEVSMICGDTTRADTWRSVLDHTDIVFHLAALEYNRKHFNVWKDWEINALSVYQMMEACRESCSSAKIVFASSSNIYGFVESECISEESPDNPPCLWSAHKLLSENYLRVYAHQYGIPSVALRLANVYGPPGNPDTLTNVVVNRATVDALSMKSLKLYKNRNCLRDFIYIDDVVRAFLCVAVSKTTSPMHHMYLVGSGSKKTLESRWGAIAEVLERLTGQEIHIEIDDSVSLEPLDHRSFVIDSSRLKASTDWFPVVSFEQGITSTVDAIIQIHHGEKTG